MNSLGTGIRLMRTYEEIEQAARVLVRTSKPDSAGHRIGRMMLEMLKPSTDEHTEGAPETSSHCEETVEYLRGTCTALRGEIKTLRDRNTRMSDDIISYRHQLEELKRVPTPAEGAREALKAADTAPRASVEFEAQRAETDDEMKQRLGLDAVAWAKEFGNSLRRYAGHGKGILVSIAEVEELALGWFANLIHHAETYVPRNRGGDVIFRMGPERDVLERWAKDGYFDHYSDAARMVMEFCQIQTHKYIQVQNIMERFGEVQWCKGAAAGAQADSDHGIDSYSAGIKDTAARLKNVLDREGLLPPDRHPEDHQ